MMRAFRDLMGLARSPEELLERYDALHEDQVRRLGTNWKQGRKITRSVVGTLLRDEGISMTEEHWQTFLDAHWREHLRWIRMYPGAEEVLQGLRRTSLHIGLLSDVDEDSLQLCLFNFPVEPFLDSITTSDEVGVAKPHGEIFRRALSKADCEPREAIHVGDSPERDVLGASRAGMRSVLIASSGSDQSADYVVPDIKAAYQLLRRLSGEADL